MVLREKRVSGQWNSSRRKRVGRANRKVRGRRLEHTAREGTANRLLHRNDEFSRLDRASRGVSLIRESNRVILQTSAPF